MIDEISVGAPETVPAGVDQDGLSSNVQIRESIGVDRQPAIERPPHDQPVEIGQGLER